MIKADISEKSLPIYEALNSSVRLKIINLLSEKPMNIKQLAEKLGLSSAILTMHVRKLEAAKIVRSERKNINGSIQKQCFICVNSIEIEFPSKNEIVRKYNELEIPIGHYTDFSVSPICGIATTQKVIGQNDDPRFFLDPERVNAGILWFNHGYLEYKVPNFLLSFQQPEELEISMEIGSKAPMANKDWPSDITFFLNEHIIGEWTSPGDFGEIHGKNSPEWWPLGMGQHGLWKTIRITDNGSYIDDIKVSDTTLSSLDIRQKYWSFRIAALPYAVNAGGLTLFGKGFGDHSKNILFRLYFK